MVHCLMNQQTSVNAHLHRQKVLQLCVCTMHGKGSMEARKKTLETEKKKKLIGSDPHLSPQRSKSFSAAPGSRDLY